ncbi:winged helix-turn-helix domain-containing protein [Thalassococcus sp. S3]|uniref:winged helix-turn-helix domain-containing protein n=1 Tax=Thalassococcus sp. S3 TaxID=2017482 RepID=UPI0013EE7AFC|nr:winged helix-turn-helix domain-containing protein [Thalassococcus sp. S3]
MKNHGVVHSNAMLRPWLLLIGFISLFGAGYLWVNSAPWTLATLKSFADARAIHDVQTRPDRVGFLLSKDPALLKAVAWSKTGSVLYPGPATYAPTRFDLSLQELEELTHLTSEDFPASWSNYDRDGNELLYCQPAPRICLIYDRSALQNALDVSLDGVNWGVMGLLAGMGLLSFFLFWRRGTAAQPHDQLVLLPKQHSARRGTLEVALTPRDFRLLEFLQMKQGEVVTKDELYDAGWGRDFMPNSRALDQHMINLRKKLDPDKSRSPVIETVRGVGYRLLD